MELTDTNKPCGLTISFLNKVITLLFNFQWTSFLPLAFPLEAIMVPDRQEVRSTKNTSFSVAIARRLHPFPFRTRKLSPPSPMILRRSSWESRSLPGHSSKSPEAHASGLLCFFGASGRPLATAEEPHQLYAAAPFFCTDKDMAKTPGIDMLFMA